MTDTPSYGKLDNPHLVDGKYSIKDLIDIKRLRNTLEKFSSATGFTTGFLEYPSQEILVATGWRDICTKFHRAVPESVKHCKESNIYLTEQLKNLKELNIKQCKNGLVDGATPIVIKGKYIAYLATGQILFEEPDIERFKRQAETYGYDMEPYLEALSEVPVVSEDQFKNALSFLSELAVTIAETGLNNLKLKEKARKLEKEIFDRKKTALAVQENELKFRSLFDLSPQAIALSEIERGRLIDVNNKFCELTKFAKEEVVGLATTELGFYSKEDRIRFITELKKSGEVTGLEMDFKAKDGSILNALMFSKIIRIAGESFILTIFLNITEQKKLESKLQQAQKMEAMGTLAGGIAHDFNNLLMGIQGRTSLMLMESDASLSYFEHLKGIEDYIKSASDLTQQLLGFAKGGKYEAKTTDLTEFIKKQNRMFGRTRKEINIKERYDKNLWTVEIDQRQIEQVLLNIYINAWQAMPSGGDLYIQTQNIVIDEQHSKPYQVAPGNYVKISITDTGIGMDEATRQKLFDPFFTTKEKGRGTGLGLASAYGIIKNHNGFIDVYSEKGEGTTFNIYLPASEKEALNEKEADEELIKGTETVLLVDDEEMIIEIGQEIVEKLGYKVMVAKSGKEAIEIYENKPGQIDMVILDMIMPGMGGGETYDKLKEVNPDIKVLLSSGYSINGQATEILKRGCSSFIQKPFNVVDLSKKIREVLHKN